jgi:hypothetical protein
MGGWTVHGFRVDGGPWTVIMGWTSEPRLQSFEAGENRLQGCRQSRLQVGAEMIDRGRSRVHGGQSTVDGGRWTVGG